MDALVLPGISMGMELLALCDEVWVFGEATEGMAAEIASATEQGKEIIRRGRGCR